MEITEQDYELLSAYLDGMLDESERVALETRLAADETLRREMNALRQTVALVRTLPTMKAPRSFVLTAEMAGKPIDGDTGSTPPARGRIVNFVLPVLSAVASLMLVLFGVSLLVNNALSNTTASFAPQSASEVAAFASPTIDLTAVEQAALTQVAAYASEEVTTMMQEAEVAAESSAADSDQTEEMDTMSAAAPDAAMLSTDESAADTFMVPDEPMTMPSASSQIQSTLLFDAESSLTALPFTPPAAGGEDNGAASRAMPTLTLPATMKSADDLGAQGSIADSAGTEVAQQTTPAVSPDAQTPPSDAAAAELDSTLIIGMIALVVGAVLTLLSLRWIFQTTRRA